MTHLGCVFYDKPCIPTLNLQYMYVHISFRTNGNNNEYTIYVHISFRTNGSV